MEDFRDSNNRVWHYLGLAFINDAHTARTSNLLINADVHCFRRLVIYGNMLTRDAIFTNTPLPAVWHLTPDQDNYPGDHDPDANLAVVSLSLSYTYHIPRLNAEHLTITNHNSSLFWNDDNFDFSLLDTTTPSSALVTLSPYALHMGPHALGVDMYVYFRWTDPNPVSNGRVLRLRIDQDPIPVIPPDAPLLDWRLVGNPIRLIGLRALMNELRFFEGIDEFVGSLPSGEITTKFHMGCGIRAANVYAPNNVFPGMQLKLKLTNEFIPRHSHYYISIALGRLLEHNRDLVGKLIEVLFRWCSTALELWFRVAPYDNDNQD